MIPLYDTYTLYLLRWQESDIIKYSELPAKLYERYMFSLSGSSMTRVTAALILFLVLTTALLEHSDAQKCSTFCGNVCRRCIRNCKKDGGSTRVCTVRCAVKYTHVQKQLISNKRVATSRFISRKINAKTLKKLHKYLRSLCFFFKQKFDHFDTRYIKNNFLCFAKKIP